MATWGPPDDTELAAGVRFDYLIARRLRDMVEAFAEQATGAPVFPQPPPGYAIFSASGSYVVPAGVSSVIAEATGSGGGGGTSTGADGGGGGGGGELRAGTIAVTPGETLTVTITGGSFAKLLRGATVLLQANSGANGANGSGGGAGGAGGAGGTGGSGGTGIAGSAGTQGSSTLPVPGTGGHSMGSAGDGATGGMGGGGSTGSMKIWY